VLIAETKYGNKIKNTALKYEAAVRGNQEFRIFF